MAESIIQKGGGGAASDECTAAKAQVLAGYTAVTKDSGDESAAGTMINCGAVSRALNCGGSYTIPVGYHNGSGKITANSLASQTGGATATDAYVRSGYTYWKDGVKRTGTMSVPSVVSFSVAPYSTSQVIATWKNPSKGPYAGVIICAKTGGYPANIDDGRVYTGVGSSSVLNRSSSQTISGLASGTQYYFRIWMYCGSMYSGYVQTTCTPTAHGRVAYTSSGTFTVPTGVRSINIHCTGGGGSGYYGSADDRGGNGGAGGYTSYVNSITVSPGEQISVTVGSGGIYVNNTKSGGTSSASRNGSILVSANGGGGAGYTWAGTGGSEGGMCSKKTNKVSATPGCSDGGTLYSGGGQGTTTKEFGYGTLYSGGGGGGGLYIASHVYESIWSGASGGAGGGGRGGNGDMLNPETGTNGSFGTGGGGGGGAARGSEGKACGNGGSGNVIFTW